MRVTAAANSRPRVGHATRARDGEVANGDAPFVVESHDATLVALIDALGHGTIADEVAKRALATLGAVTPGDGPVAALEHVHAALQGTRGAAALVVVLRPDTAQNVWKMQAAGVGNVTMRCMIRHPPVVLTPGVLGTRMRQVRTFDAVLPRGERMVLFTDGINHRFSFTDVRGFGPDQAARALVDLHRRGHDDATVVVVDLPE